MSILLTHGKAFSTNDGMNIVMLVGERLNNHYGRGTGPVIEQVRANVKDALINANPGFLTKYPEYEIFVRADILNRGEYHYSIYSKEAE